MRSPFLMVELEPEPVSTQVVARDRHAELLSAIALAGAGMERFATELRHLARTEVGEVFRQRNEGLYSSSFAAQFISGMIMPTMMFIGNLNYVIIAVVGGLRVASGTMNLGDVQAFIQYTRMFTQPLTQVASMANLLQSGIASAERVFEVLDAEEQSAEAPASSFA